MTHGNCLALLSIIGITLMCLGDSIFYFVAVSAISSTGDNSFQTEMLEDDRLAKRVDEMDELINLENGRIDEMPMGVWERLSHLVYAPSAVKLRSVIGRASACGHAFVDMRALSVARGMPWALTRGDIHANLTRFKSAPCPVGVDIISECIYNLLYTGYNVSRRADEDKLRRCYAWSTFEANEDIQSGVENLFG